MGVASQLYLARTKSLWDAVIQPIVSSASHHPTLGGCRICWLDLLLKQFWRLKLQQKNEVLGYETCMHLHTYHTRTIKVCTRPELSPCWSLFWKVEVGACLDFMEWCNFIFSEPFSALQIRPAAIWCGWDIMFFASDSMDGWKDQTMLKYKLLSVNCWCGE